jgi:hypothetical protein
MTQPSKFTPILVSSVIMITISLFPVLNLVNLLCCAGIILGGFAGTAYYNKSLTAAGQVIQFKDGAAIGILSGIVSALIVVIASTLLTIALKENPVPEALRLIETYGFQVPPAMEEFLQKISNEYNKSGFSITLTLITLVVDLITYPLFAAIGGILGVSILKRKGKAVDS